MKVQKIICDECGAYREDANHWFMVHANLNTVYFNPINEEITPMLHICGQKCAHSVLDRWMTTGKIDK